jgi:protein arginine kinase
MSRVQDLLKQPSLWTRLTGPEADVALLSRVRLARNLSGCRFPERASNEERRAVLDRVSQQADQVESLQGAHRLDLDGLSDTPRGALGERRLLGERLLMPSSERRLFVAPDESQSFVVNGEDHVEMQAQVSGLDLQGAFETCDALDVELDSRLDFAYSETYGFLTSRPERSGTGLRAGVLVYLPGLALGNQLQALCKELQDERHECLPFHPSSRQGEAHLFVVSNQSMVGKRQGEIVRDLDAAVRTLLDRERQERQRLFSGAQSLLADRIWRSYGILSQARLLKARETLRHACRLLLGVQLGLLEIPASVLVELFALSQDAHTRMRMQTKANGQYAMGQEVEEWRAERVRNELQGLNS